MKRVPLFVTVLVWCVLGSLMLAIGSELSAQRFWRERMGGGGAVEGFASGTIAMGGDAINGLNPIVQTRMSLPPAAPLPPQAQQILKQSPQQVMVYYQDQPLMANLGEYLASENASEPAVSVAAGAGAVNAGAVAGSPELKERRKPFLLVGDVLPAVPLQERKANSKETSQRCYESDYEVRTEKVGNYTQRTNNYLRAAPDSCTAPNHELV
jgi:hypothetical protein